MLKAYYQLTKFDKDDKILSKSRKKKSRSFLKQMGQYLYSVSVEAGLTINDIDGAGRVPNSPTSWLSSVSSGKDEIYTNSYSSVVYNQGHIVYPDMIGIVLGSNNTAVTINDYALNIRIDNGTTANKLEYLSCATSNYQVSGGNASFDLVRIFRNSSGGTITVREVGIYSIFIYSSIYTNVSPYCIVRDIVSPAQSISDGEYLKVTYTIQV